MGGQEHAENQKLKWLPEGAPASAARDGAGVCSGLPYDDRARGRFVSERDFVPAEENGVTVYSGKLRGKQAEFTVSADKTVSFRCDGQTYGPYTVKEDPTARPDLEIQLETGVELWEGDTLLFRGGFWQSDGSFWLRNADGSMDLGMQTYVVENGVKKDSDGISSTRRSRLHPISFGWYLTRS